MDGNKDGQRLEDQIKRLKHRLREQNKRVQKLSIMFEISRDIAAVFELNKVLEVLVNKATGLLGTEIGSILLWDKDGKYLIIKAAKGLEAKIIDSTRIKMGERISGWVAQHRKSILVEDIEKDRRFARRNEEKYYTKSLISVPLKVKDKVIGIINVNNKKTRGKFAQGDLELLEAIASQGSLAIENAYLYEEVHHVYMHTIRALAITIDSKDHYTYHHSINVVKYAAAIAHEMKLARHEVQDIKHACQLHDLGKISVPDYILAKPGKLNKEEWEKVKLHVQKSVEILGALPLLDRVVGLIAEDHERYDGAGYPKGIKGKKILLGSRIMLVADAFDAMTSERPYRKKLSVQEAIEELKKNSSTQFDPHVVKAFLEVLKREPGIVEGWHV